MDERRKTERPVPVIRNGRLIDAGPEWIAEVARSTAASPRALHYVALEREAQELEDA